MLLMQIFVRCNGAILPVSTNLFNGMRRLRGQPSIRYLWVDCLCINQSDVAERSQQAQKIGQVYNGARLVPIWLGERRPNYIRLLVD